MPGGDGTGPPGLGLGMGWGGGRWGCRRPAGYGYGGHGWRHWYRATGQPDWLRGGWREGWNPHLDDLPPTTVSERDLLRRQAEALEHELQRIRTLLEEIEERPQAGPSDQGGRA